MQQPDLKNNYYLKEELVAFCREHNLQTAGSKEELTKRIATYLETGEKTTKKKPAISKQFEYNTYIHDFFQNNKDKSLSDAIKCWDYKKKKPGSHKYEKQDLDILKHLF